MEKLFVAEVTNQKDKETCLDIKEEISVDERNHLNSAFKDLGIFHSITEIKDIVVFNGIEFKQYIEKKNITYLYNQRLPVAQILLRANRYALNYASSIKTFLDIEKRLLTKNKPEKIKDFEKLTHNFYDSHMEYRFWCNFRNYVVHCALPYTVFHGDESKGCMVCCTKSHLLEFHNWKHSEKDIVSMPEIVNLTELVDNMSSLIIALYLDFYSYWAEDIVKSIGIYGEFCRKHNVKQPTIVKCVDGELPTDMQPLPIRELNEVFSVLRSNPHIKINILNEEQ